MWAAVVALGCGDREPPPRTAPPPPPLAAATAPASPPVARVGGETITADDVDAGLRLPLHDLDRARWALRAERLRRLLVARVLGPRAAAEGMTVDAWVAERAGDDPAARRTFVDAALAAAGAEVLLEPPEPPLVAVDADDDPVRGPADAPVTILEFLDFQSPYCRAMQPVLRRALDAYPRHVRLVVRDFPQPVHRYAVAAAEAADCAGAQGRYWPYHDALLQADVEPGRAALDRYAERVGLDLSRFSTCVDARTSRAEVEHDADAARALGLTVVPTFFVNGRYLKGPQTDDELRGRIETELIRLGIDPADARATPSTTTTTTAGAPTTAPPPSAAEPDRPTTPSAIVTLPAARVQAALRDRARLAHDLERRTGPGLDGRHFVRIRRAPPDGLYAAMGLEPGDLLGTVDGTPLFDKGDALFDALRDQRTVRLRIIRRGLVHDFEYRIE